MDFVGVRVNEGPVYRQGGTGLVNIEPIRHDGCCLEHILLCVCVCVCVWCVCVSVWVVGVWVCRVAGWVEEGRLSRA